MAAAAWSTQARPVVGGARGRSAPPTPFPRGFENSVKPSCKSGFLCRSKSGWTSALVSLSAVRKELERCPERHGEPKRSWPVFSSAPPLHSLFCCQERFPKVKSKPSRDAETNAGEARRDRTRQGLLGVQGSRWALLVLRKLNPQNGIKVCGSSEIVD